MKKFLLIPVLLFILITSSSGQGGDRMYRKFKGEFSLGYARFANDAEIKNGFIIALEPKLLVLDQLAISARLESVLLGKNFETIAGNGDEDFKFKAYQSALFAAEYYFTKDFKVRPFAGGGIGAYSVVSTGYGYYYDEVYGDDRQVKFGEMIRAGVELRHFRIGLEYNFIPNTTNTYYDNSGNTIVLTNKNSYFGMKLGYCFSGGLLNRN
jgi:hypothetical protein